jgi:hypothetical protein
MISRDDLGDAGEFLRNIYFIKLDKECFITTGSRDIILAS